MNDYKKTIEEVTKELKTDLKDGLSSLEAKDRLERDGKNELQERKKDSKIKKFFMEMKNPMVIVLIVAALISLVTSIINEEFPFDVLIIMFVVILNAVLGVIQEAKAEQAIEALKNMSKATARVIRDGKPIVLPTDELVVGDVILLEAGESIPADCRVVESYMLKVEEAALTGEPIGIEKYTKEIVSEGNVILAERKNMCYTGSSVVYGRGKGVVIATGMNTEMGMIAKVISETVDEKTPLQRKLAELSKILSYLVLIICFLVFVVDILRFSLNGKLSFILLVDTLMIAVSLAVAAIPEGLVAVITLVLSIGVTNMSKKKAIIRKLTAVETLGSTQIICSDKTGTITENKMTVVKDFTNEKELLCIGMTLCNDASLVDGEGEGEATEVALVNYSFKNSFDQNKLLVQYPRVEEIPFDSIRKMMTTFHSNNGKVIQFTKGAPDEIFRHSTQIISNGSIEELSDSKRNEYIGKYNEYSDSALRVLALGVRYYDSLSDVELDSAEDNLVLVGLVGMIDPIRKEVFPAIKECKEAGIRPIMITGDHLNTAVAIAKELGIINSKEEALTGYDLSDISDEELFDNIEKYSVYARVQPEHKVRIVKAWKKKGFITAMTGDGVNDAPAIKQADIGVGMGITGTDVTKNVADLVLADDNFATIVRASEEGRRIYSNIRKAIQFLLSSNFAEVIAIFFASLLGFMVLKAPHLLWINLLTDTFPAIALGLEDKEKDIMKQKPRNPKESIFSNGVGYRIVFEGFLVGVLTLLSFYIGRYFETGLFEFVPQGGDSKIGMTMAFLTLSFVELFHAFNLRSLDKSLFTIKRQNKYLILAFIGGLVLTILVIYVPFLAKAFDFVSIKFTYFLISFGLGFSIIPLVEIEKLIRKIFLVAKKSKNIV